MSTSPDLVNTLSRYLAGHADVGQVQKALDEPQQLGPESRVLVAELRGELQRPEVTLSKLQPLVRETIEAIALDE